ncbi:methylated-DNA--[protein]-cysteine S-methyltransferase [Actinoallomurus spadix]|uniref:Methylated-DNA--[protein]-cysteine S-methyltransferase n=1 Tax=Actinoallomurus spadix TaxID=79912 RepID=A0ABP3GXL3_9ACTN|nr:methylated-DNA--[protein]-cysteine S-methyltransferase [Actinoallomurus spadix]MCO5986052.1 methylated-DNA--[protein]-cysteine S-methyltransferase [Actinoallomurus spadix]
MDVAIGSLDTPLGRLAFACTAEGLCGLSFRDTPRDRALLRAGLSPVHAPERTEPVREQLSGYFAGGLRAFDLPIDWHRTSGAQREVLEKLYAGVPYGETVTYGRLADLSGTGVPARAIGSIMGSNPIPIVVPCHRIVASDGLGGYSGGSGVEVKRWLLTMEGAIPATLDWDPSAGPLS